MADFDAQVRESQAQVAEAQSKISELTSKIETARAKLESGTELDLDIENASLADVHAHTAAMDANIAELIMGLDDVTSGFSEDFSAMRDKTGWESFVGIFSSGKSESMRQERMRTAVEQDAAARTKLETELAAMNTDYNEKVQAVQVKLAKSQTLERYIEQGKTWIDSLQNQAATQMVLINKLETDTKQRVVLYDALTKSLKTAQQQDVAHQINEIGVKTDQEAQSAMAGIGAATNKRMAEMMEAHEDQMVFARKVLEQKAKADERFARRFEQIVEKHDKNIYGG